MSKKHAAPTKYLWVDLEMTGLVPEKDVILEVATEVTGTDLETISSYEAIVQHKKDKVAKLMQENIWWNSYPKNRDVFLGGVAKGKPLAAVERELIEIVEHDFGDEPAILAGNSIHSDRAFIKQWMPQLDLRLHYRMLDVSAWKVVMQSMYGVQFRKPAVHRAYDDIQASIAELQYYLEWFANNANTKGQE